MNISPQPQPPHCDETLIQTRTTVTPMERLQHILSKLAATHPNCIPLTSTLHQRFNHFVSRYQTPDHPPYSAMIERALGELKDKRGSSEDSISQFLEKMYSNLPLAHSAFLKHHLAKLCESGDIVATSGKRYMLPMETPTLNLNTKFERRPKRRKCRWAWEREQKKRLKKKRNLRRSKQIDVFENGREPVEEIEHQVCSKNKEVEQGQTKRLSSCDGKDIVYGDPSVLPTEKSYHCEIGPSKTTGGDECTVHTQEQQEMKQAQYDPPKDLSPEMPPGFEFIRVENLSNVDLKATQSSDEDTVETDRTLRWLRCLTEKSEPRSMTAICPKVEASPKLGFSHSNLVSYENQHQIIDLTLPSVDQNPCEKQQMGSLETDAMEVSQSGMGNIKLKGDKIYCRRRKRTSEQSESTTQDACIKPKQHNLEQPSKVSSPNSNKLLNKQESHNVVQQQSPPQHQQEEISDGKQLRRSSRRRIPNHDISKCGNDVHRSDQESLIRSHRHQPRQPKGELSGQFTDESQRKCKLKRKFVLRDVDDNTESKSNQVRKNNGLSYRSNFKQMVQEETRAGNNSRVARKGKKKRCDENDENYLPPPVILALGQRKGKGKGKGKGQGPCKRLKLK